MAQIAEVKISEVSTGGAALGASDYAAPISIRVSPVEYFAAFFLLTFFTGFLVYLEKDYAAAFLCLLNWTVIPALALNDKIVFDGKNLYRTGIIPEFWRRLRGRPAKLEISQIEQIETQALRALKRGGNIFYRYRTAVQGAGIRFAFASGGEDYQRMIAKLFKTAASDALDNRSLELRDYLSEAKEVLMKAEFARIPSAEVLEDSAGDWRRRTRKAPRGKYRGDGSPTDAEKADELRLLANELRLSGYLLQSLEAFRRALLVKPGDACLLFEFARALHSYANLERNKKIAHRANAALRLAEKGADGKLLARLGESYFQYGEWRRAKICFNKTLRAQPENFRAVRGLAEIALREGKIAHVIHHFASAGHFAASLALKRWAQNETEYFSRLNSDEEYMETEIRRIKRLETIERGRATALRLALAGTIIVLGGLLLDETIANIGWACSIISLAIWLALVASRNLLIKRSSPLKEES